MFKFTFKSLLLILLSLYLSGCDELKRVSMSQICEEESAICQDLHQFGDCRYLRTSLIRARYDHIQAPTEKNVLLLLEESEGYKTCLEPKLQIAYTRYKDRKQKRLDNYATAQKIVDKLLVNAAGTRDPNLAYYLWTNHQDLQAKKVFLNAANQSNLTDASVLSKLAVYYSADEPQRAVDFYYKALRSSKNIEELPSSMFLQLVSLFYRHHLYRETYRWAKVAMLTSEEPAPIRLDMIAKRGYISEEALSKLDDEAEDYVDDLEDGKFKKKTPLLHKPQ